ncbi:hypothetical protein ACO2Q8_04250 [Larkinella sp. VNQ87]|uniref:hypothetical protein n=1 Tax=Larkinella sp. VNQ87 TaxID=3400921 RepID=UPI003C0B7986
MHHFLRFLSSALLLILLNHAAVAQIIYSENFSSGLNGWTVSSTTAIVSSTVSPSSGYTTPVAASGGNNMSFGECAGPAEQTATSPVINTVGQTNVAISFGIRKTAAFGPQVVLLEFSTDGGSSWTTISADVSSSGTTTWAVSMFTLPGSAENQASLTFRFRYTPPSGSGCATSFRVDDFVVSATNALPVELATFRATAERDRNQLVWETAWERKASHFVIERSTDAVAFTSIGQVEAVGETANRQRYTFTDGEPLPGISYYRLRQVDRDGAMQVSKWVSVSRGEEPVVLVENPVLGGDIRLRARELAPNRVQLLTMTGQILLFGLRQKTETEWLLQPLYPLKPGLYLIRVGLFNQWYVLRLLVR